MVSIVCPKCGSSDYRTENIMRQNACAGEYQTDDIYNICNTCHHTWYSAKGVQ